MKILFTGGDGHLNSKFKELNDSEFIFLNKQELDITNPKSIQEVFESHDFDYVIHSAALTRPMSLHDEKPELSIDVNIIGTANIVKECIKHDKKLIYISTDYVYDGVFGKKTELDGVKPFNKYGWSKLGGECSVQLHENHLIIRLAMVEYPFPYEAAFDNVYKSCLWSDEVPEKILKLIDQQGIINLGGKPQSIYHFAKERYPNLKRIQANQELVKNTTLITTKVESLLRKL